MLVGDVLQLAAQAPPDNLTDLVRALHHDVLPAGSGRAANAAITAEQLATLAAHPGPGHPPGPATGGAGRAGRTPTPPEKRFFTKVTADDGDGDCWIWTGTTRRGRDGSVHGIFVVNASRANRKTMHARRWAYEFLRAEIPTGLILASRCGTALCVNPWHMDPVRRQFGPERRTHCPRGHLYAVHGVWDRTGHKCKRCAADAAWSRRRAQGCPTRQRTAYGP